GIVLQPCLRVPGPAVVDTLSLRDALPFARARAAELTRAWDAAVDAAYGLDGDPLPQPAVIGAVNAAAGDDGVVICAARSMPGDLDRKSTRLNSSHVTSSYGGLRMKQNSNI